MHCVIAQADLAHALKTVSRAVASTKGTHPILASVLLTAGDGALTITAYDLDLGVRAVAPASVLTAGVACVPYRLLSELVAAQDADEAISLALDGQRLAISCAGGSYGITCADPEDYPALPSTTATAAPVALGGALAAVLPCCSTDQAKALLGGVHLAADGQRLRLEATDGHRLAVRHQPADGLALDLILPARTLQLVARLDQPLQLAVDKQLCSITAADGTQVISRVLDGQYPQVQSLIPTSYGHTATCDRQSLLDALGRIAVIAHAHNSIVRVTAADGVLAISAETETSNGQAQLAFDGSLPDFAANVDYLVDGLRNMIGKEVTICANSATTPIVFKIDDQVYLVMPVQIRANA